MYFVLLAVSTTNAYILYTAEHDASDAYERAKSNPVHLDGRPLTVMRYRTIPKNIAPGILNDIFFSRLTC